MDNIPHSTEKITNLDDAIEIVETWLKMMLPEDRRIWWDDEDESPYNKIAKLIKQQMPEYEINIYLDHRDTDEDLIDDVLSVFKESILNRTITDFQYAQFWSEDVGHERFYISAIKAE